MFPVVKNERFIFICHKLSRRNFISPFYNFISPKYPYFFKAFYARVMQKGNANFASRGYKTPGIHVGNGIEVGEEERGIDTFVQCTHVS